MNQKQLLNYLRKSGFQNKIIDAFGNVERENFVAREFMESAYENIPLPIGLNATISQPYTIAFMLNLLELRDNLKIFEVGSGSGYVLALINDISKKSQIYGIEINKELADKSGKLLKYHDNIKVIHGDGSRGLEKEKPFNRILVSAASDTIPQKLVNQLSFNGIMVCSVKNSIIKVIKKYGENRIEEYPGFVFVPLTER